jgi:tRNA-Thr(GGU) m(6)t(6)A37 methyltransferase TsaA
MSNFPLQLDAIGVLHSPFKEKFGIPRQSGIIKSCTAEIELFSPYNDIHAVKGLEAFSDIWVIFAFHQHLNSDWRPMIRPPRLGGNKKIGVFASRAPYRPNHLGLSRVQLINIQNLNGKAKLIIACPDILDGTPIYDIKPYIHYADANPEARCGFAPAAPESKFEVIFSQTALAYMNKLNPAEYPNLINTIKEVLEIDPRPAYKQEANAGYGFKLYDLNIRWFLKDGCVTVEDIYKPV